MLVHALLSQLNTGEKKKTVFMECFMQAVCPMYLEKYTVIALAKLYIIISGTHHLYPIEHCNTLNVQKIRRILSLFKREPSKPIYS